MRRAPSQIDRDLRAIAASQLGVVTTAQAAATLISEQSMSFRRSSGQLDRLFPGVVTVDGHHPPFQRLLAAALAVDDSTIAGPSAGLILGLPVGKRWAEPDAPVVLNVPSHRVVRLSGVQPVRSSVPLPNRPWMGARLATPAAVVALLPKFVDAHTVQRCLDHCLVERLTTVAAVTKVIEAQPYRAVTGRAMLLELLAARAGRAGHRSRLEQRVAGWLTDAGLGGWRSNHSVHVSRGGPVEVDFAWCRPKVALEISPFYTHGSQATQERDMVRRRLLLQAGWKVVEATHSDLIDKAAFHRIAVLLRQIVS